VQLPANLADGPVHILSYTNNTLDDAVPVYAVYQADLIMERRDKPR
jgi:hypothetical protein